MVLWGFQIPGRRPSKRDVIPFFLERKRKSCKRHDWFGNALTEVVPRERFTFSLKKNSCRGCLPSVLNKCLIFLIARTFKFQAQIDLTTPFK